MNGGLFRVRVLLFAVCLLVSGTVSAVSSTWVGGSTGVWTNSANWSAGVPQTTGDTATVSSPTTIAVPTSLVLKALTVNAAATITVASGATIAFSNGGGDIIIAGADLLINGDGNLTVSRNGTSTTDFANIKPASGATITLAARISGEDGAGIELNGAGTLLLTNPGNLFTGMTRISTINGTLAFSDPAALGSTAVRFDASPSTFAYTGTGPATLTLPVQLNGTSAIFKNAGSGMLTLSGAISAVSSGAKTLTFTGATQTNVISGSLSNGSGLVTVVSDAGTLVLNGTVTDSTVTATDGGILAIGGNAAFQNGTLTCNTGSTLALNPSAADSFAVTLALTNSLAGAGVHWILPAAASASTVTLPTLVRSSTACSVDIAADHLGTVSNTLIVQTFSAGLLPSWITVNGGPAAYDETLGIIPAAASGATQSLTALGPSIITNDATAAAVIDAAGISGGITLAADPTTVFSLTQAHADNPAIVDLGGQTLAATLIAISESGNNLTLTNGTLTAPSAQTAPSGTAVFPTLAAAPIAWFDLSDTSAVTTNADGRISLLANKGSLGSTLDAAVPSDRIGPRYVPNAVNGLGVARSDGIVPPQGLATLGNAGITGSVARTAFLVAARSPVTQNSFYALYLGPDSNVNQDFCICERTDRTSFSTKGNDLESSSASPVGCNVLTFITGLNDTPNAGAGYRNGVLLGTKTFAFATVDAPIRLLHRPVTAANFSGPGDVAEVLIFDYTLSDTDRAAVEDYLMQKWGIAAQCDDALLALRNDNPASELSISAALTESYGTTLALAKSGSGNAVLSSPVTFSGSLLLNEGALTFDTPAGHTTVVAAPVSGSGPLFKTGAGSLALSQSSPYTGGTVVQGGTLLPGANGSLGSGSVTIENGGALDIANGSATAPSTGTAAFSNPITVEGSGPDGLGALRYSGGVTQLNAFASVALSGDTAVYSASRFDVRSGVFDFGGHSLTVNGGGEFSISHSVVSNVTAATAIYVTNGVMRFEQSDFQGSSDNVADAASGAGVCLFQMTVPVMWSLQLADDASFSAIDGGMNTNLNVWAGPVTLASGTARLTTPDDDASAAVTGSIGGNGGLLKEGDGWFWLLNSANTYAGTTAVTQGNLYATSPHSLGSQAVSGLTVSGSGALIARTASTAFPDGWTESDLGAISFAATETTALGFDTADEDFSYAGDLPYVGLKKLGSHTLTLTGSAQDLGDVDVYNGELDLSGTGTHDLHGYSVSIGAASDAASLAVLRLADASLNTDDPGYYCSGPSLTVGSATNSRSIFYVGKDAAANGQLLVGNGSGSAGAVYQTGGTVTNTGGLNNDAALGVYGFGYYRLDAGELANKGSTQLGRYSGSTGIFEQRGGDFVLNAGTAPDTGVVGDYYNGSLTTRKGVGIFLLSGGTFTLNTHSLQLGEWASAGDYNDGYGVLTLESNAQANVGWVCLANRNGNAQGYVNLNGGELTASYFQKGGNNTSGNSAMAAIGFNGGVLHIPSTGNITSALVRTGSYNSPALLNVYAGGAVIDTPASANITIDQPLLAPANFGVASVSVTSVGAGYIAPPAVTFSGGNGTGATAVAEIDLTAGTLTGIRVTSPGAGYTSVPTVTLRGGGYVTSAAASAALSTTASGGLTKLGAGLLTLTAASTYTGPTIISNGTLRLTSGNQALSSASAITLADGTLDLAGGTLTNNNPVIVENGRLINGSISAPSFVKASSGTVTLSTSPEHASETALYETYVRSLTPLVWYDPSDAATVTLDANGRVTALLNKGSKSAMDAAIGYTNGGYAMISPLLATGALSYAVSQQPMLMIDSNRCGLASASNLGLTGSVPRTVVCVMTRDTDTSSAVVSYGVPTTGQLFEVGDRGSSSKVIVGCYGGSPYDLIMDPVNTARAVNVYIAATTSSTVNEAWRTGVAPLHGSTSFAVNTGDSRFLFGQRPGTSDRAEFRGQIGEVLIFDRVLNDSERTELQRLLVKKWMTQPSEETEASGAAVTVSGGTLRLSPDAGVVARLAPIIWYDPSDPASVTLDANGRVTGLANKGTKTGMDAVTGISNGGSPLLAPRFATGTLSYAASDLPMIGIDSNNCGLASGATTGITGSSPRTVVGIFARDNTTSAGPVTSFGTAGTAQLYEVGDRQNGNVIGCFGTGNDFIVTPLNPVQQANVHIAANTATNVNAFWRTGVEPTSATFTIANALATGDSRFFIGQRPATANRSDFRGQIGEILVFDRLLTDNERIDLKEYLANKWTQTNGTNNLFNGTAFDVAEGATLDLAGSRDNITVTGSGTVTNGTLGAGVVISPAGDDAVGELTLADVAFGAGAEYRLTIIGNTCDHLLVDGDLSGLTVVPATDAEITGHTYIIATGTTTSKPALSGFPSKFKIRRRGNDILLTTVGGTVLTLQ